MAVKVLAGQASSILSQARAAAWLPELPPKGNAPVSPYIAEILQYLDVSSHRPLHTLCMHCAYVQQHLMYDSIWMSCSDIVIHTRPTQDGQGRAAHRLYELGVKIHLAALMKAARDM